MDDPEPTSAAREDNELDAGPPRASAASMGLPARPSEGNSLSHVPSEARNGSGATLVLGGSGFLGAHVVVALGPRAVSASRAEGPNALAGGGRFVKLDARTPGSLAQVLDAVKPAAIVDCAAFSSVGEAETNPDLARRMNVDVPRELGRWCAASGARLVHVS